MYFLFLKSFLTLASSYFLKIKIISIEKTLKSEKNQSQNTPLNFALFYALIGVILKSFLVRAGSCGLR